MRFPSAFVMRILKVAGHEDAPGRMVVVVRREYSYLLEELKPTFDGQGDVDVIIDRRAGDRRRRHESMFPDRRKSDRRRSKEDIVEVVISE